MGNLFTRSPGKEPAKEQEVLVRRICETAKDVTVSLLERAMHAVQANEAPPDKKGVEEIKGQICCREIQRFCNEGLGQV